MGNTLVFSPHPLLLGKDRELVYAAFLPRETILEYLRRTGLLERMGRQPFNLAVDGRRLPRTLWAHCRPKPGTLINLYAMVQGGGGGKKNPLAALAMIALTLYAPQLAATVPGAGTAAALTSLGRFVQVGGMVVGGMVINSIFPPPRPDLARAQNLGGGDSPTYAIQGGSNRMRRYEPMLKICGVHRVFPDFGAQPFNEFEGNDQVAYYIADFGYNDCDLSDWKIGDTPLEQFEGVELEVSGADGELAIFPGNVDSIAGVELTAGLGFVSRTSSPDARQLAVEITGALFFLADEGTEIRPATVDIEYRAVGAGPWTALQLASDATPSMSIVEGVARVPSAQYTHGVRKEITAQPVEDIGLTVLSASSNTPAGVGTLRYGFNKAVHSGAWQWTPPGGQTGLFVRVREGGQFVLFDATRTMSLLISVNNHAPSGPLSGDLQHTFTIGSNTIAGRFMLMNGTREPLRRTFKWHVAEGQYEVRVKKSSPDETSQRAVAQIVWSQLRTYQPDEADYTGRLRVGLKVRASALANGVLQQLSAIARAKCQVWDGGQWVQARTSNPAFWYIDALRGKTINGRRVYGGGLADSRIDLDGLKGPFAAWCDAEGLTFNGVFDQQTSLYELLSAIALMGRATPTMQTGKHGALWDAPDLPATALFGMHNIIPGSFEIDYASGDLADVIEVWFINPELNWQRDFVRALVPGATSQARVRRVETFGCSSKAQAGQIANLYAAANFYRPRRYKWRSDWEQMPSPRGDVVQLGHDVLKMLSGRFIEGGNTTTLKLPRLVPLYEAGGFVTVVEPNGDFDTYPVNGGVGETDTLTLPSALPFNPWADLEHPPYDYRWHYGPSSITGRKVKIDSFKPVSERYVDVTAVDEDPAYYAAKDNALVALPPPHLFGQVQLQALNVTEDGVRAGKGYLARVLVSWDVAGDYGFADVRASIAGGPAELLAAGVRGRNYSFNVQDFTDVVVEVTAWSSFGRHGKSSKLMVEHHVDYAGQSPPSDPSEFFLDDHTFRWLRAPEVDVVGSRIRFHYGENRNLADANELHAGLLASSPASFDVLPSGTVTFFCTEVDAAGLESVAPAIIVRNLGDPELENVVERVDFEALSFPGTLTGGTEVGDDLEASGTTAFYGSDGAAFYGADADPFYADEVYEEMVYTTEIFYFSIDWIDSAMTLEHQLEGLGVFIEFRQTNEDPFYGDDAADFYGADADPFYGADGDWRPWPGTVSYSGGDVQLRITTAAGPVKGAVRELSMVIDVPDVIEHLNDIAIPQGGARLALTKDFDFIKTAQLTVQDDGGAAKSARYLDKDPVLGPLVECIDETGASVAGTLDATITGR